MQGPPPVAFIEVYINILYYAVGNGSSAKGFLLNRDNLTHAVRERLQRLPAPYAAHYGVVPLPPPEDGVAVGSVLARLRAADAALVRIETLAAELKDPYLISRILPRREAVSSSAI